MTRTYTFEEELHRALGMARRRSMDEPGRLAALVVTKLEEAVLWNDVWRQMNGLDALGLEWTP